MLKQLHLTATIIAILLLFSGCCPNEQPVKAKYIFYFIGDGMGITQVNGTEMYLAEIEGRIGIKPLNFTQFPTNNFATTYSTHNSVTCSAASGTALACGIKTKNGCVGVDSLGNPIYSIAEKAKQMGKKVGITTSVGANHATPAAFYGHQPKRNMYYEISQDLIKAGFDFHAGGGFISSNNISDSVLFEEFSTNGYTLIRGTKDFTDKSKDAERIILIPDKKYEDSSLPYAIDRQEGEMTLSQITESAIDFLKRDAPNGFFLMVEGGKIDWAGHANDPATNFAEVIDMADAVEKALEFYKQHPDETLIVITADHETGGLALGTGKYSLNLKALQHQKCSKDEINNELKRLRVAKNNKVDWNDVKALLSDKLGFWNELSLTEKQEKKLKKVFNETFKSKEGKMDKSLYASYEPLATASVKVLCEIAQVGWSSGGHSANVVPVYAIGAGAHLFNGKLDNTDIPKTILKIMQ